MASIKNVFVILLVVLVAMDTANGYLRLGREMEKSNPKKQRSLGIDNIEKAVAAKVLRNIADCVVEVGYFPFLKFMAVSCQRVKLFAVFFLRKNMSGRKTNAVVFLSYLILVRYLCE